MINDNHKSIPSIPFQKPYKKRHFSKIPFDNDGILIIGAT